MASDHFRVLRGLTASQPFEFMTETLGLLILSREVVCYVGQTDRVDNSAKKVMPETILMSSELLLTCNRPPNALFFSWGVVHADSLPEGGAVCLNTPKP